MAFSTWKLDAMCLQWEISMGPLSLTLQCRTGGGMSGLVSLSFCGREKCVV